MSRHNLPLLIPARRSRRVMASGVAWLAIVALLGLLAMPMMGMDDPADGRLAGLCTNGDAASSALAADGTSIPVPKSHAGRACPFCLAHAGGFTLPLPVAVPLAPTTFGATVRPVLPAGVTPKAFFRTGCQSRAPPRLTV